MAHPVVIIVYHRNLMPSLFAICYLIFLLCFVLNLSVRFGCLLIIVKLF